MSSEQSAWAQQAKEGGAHVGEAAVLKAPRRLSRALCWYLPPSHACQSPAHNVLGVPELCDHEDGGDHEVDDEIIGEAGAEEEVERCQALHMCKVVGWPAWRARAVEGAAPADAINKLSKHKNTSQVGFAFSMYTADMERVCANATPRAQPLLHQAEPTRTLMIMSMKI